MHILYQIENLRIKFDSYGDLERSLDSADDVKANKLVKYVDTHSSRTRSLLVVMQLSLGIS